MIELSAFEIKMYLALEEVFKFCDLKEVKITNFKIQRIIGDLVAENNPANNSGVNIFGMEEYNYLKKLTKLEKERKLRNYFNLSPKLIILIDNIDEEDIVKYMRAENTECVIFKTKSAFQEINRVLKKIFRKKLQEETKIEETLFMEIFGMGLLIQGEKSIRNSLALELMNKKHSFISNEDVRIIKYSGSKVYGKNQMKDYNKYILKMSNGLKFDILKNFGTAVGRRSKRIDMLLVLDKWSPKKKYERLGLDEEFERILEVDIPKVVIPIKMGRSLSVIVEAVALNRRLKSQGEHSSAIFFDETKKLIRRNSMESQKKTDNKFHYIKKFEEKSKLKKISGLSEEIKIENPELYYPLFGAIQSKNSRGRFHILDEYVSNQLRNFSDEDRKNILDRYFQNEIQGILVENRCPIKNEIENYCKEKNINLYENINDFTITLDHIEEVFEQELSPKATLHGVLMEIYGLGVLITGKSGVGKSETGLELVTRGHRLISDDRVEVILSPDRVLNGYCGEIPYFMELRGMGVINVRSLYGIGAVKESKTINIVVEIVEDENNEFIEDQMLTENILGKEITKKIIYINTGRNTATLLEAVALDYKSKRLEIEGEF